MKSQKYIKILKLEIYQHEFLYLKSYQLIESSLFETQ